MRYVRILIERGVAIANPESDDRWGNYNSRYQLAISKFIIDVCRNINNPTVETLFYLILKHSPPFNWNISHSDRTPQLELTVSGRFDDLKKIIKLGASPLPLKDAFSGQPVLLLPLVAEKMAYGLVNGVVPINWKNITAAIEYAMEVTPPEIALTTSEITKEATEIVTVYLGREIETFLKTQPPSSLALDSKNITEIPSGKMARLATVEAAWKQFETIVYETTIKQPKKEIEKSLVTILGEGSPLAQQTSLLPLIFGYLFAEYVRLTRLAPSLSDSKEIITKTTIPNLYLSSKELTLLYYMYVQSISFAPATPESKIIVSTHSSSADAGPTIEVLPDDYKPAEESKLPTTIPPTPKKESKSRFPQPDKLAILPGEIVIQKDGTTGELKWTFATKEERDKTLQKLGPPQQILAAYRGNVNGLYPPFIKNPDGLTPKVYPGLDKVIFFPTYTPPTSGKNLEVAVSLVTEQARNLFIRALGLKNPVTTLLTTGQTSNTYGDKGEITTYKGLNKLTGTQQNTGAYFKAALFENGGCLRITKKGHITSFNPHTTQKEETKETYAAFFIKLQRRNYQLHLLL